MHERVKSRLVKFDIVDFDPETVQPFCFSCKNILPPSGSKFLIPQNILFWSSWVKKEDNSSMLLMGSCDGLWRFENLLDYYNYNKNLLREGNVRQSLGTL